MGDKFKIRFDMNPMHWEIPTKLQDEYVGLEVEAEEHESGSCLVKISAIVEALEKKNPESKAAKWLKKDKPWRTLYSCFGPTEYTRI